mmetsp:Transcript_38093/g.91451  ORF Transcript_38093/g.91451 Transcript_38093/m.91451 type:complete len:249 (+) Transcript_38093:2925-3671(+)
MVKAKIPSDTIGAAVPATASLARLEAAPLWRWPSEAPNPNPPLAFGANPSTKAQPAVRANHSIAEGTTPCCPGNIMLLYKGRHWRSSHLNICPLNPDDGFNAIFNCSSLTHTGPNPGIGALAMAARSKLAGGSWQAQDIRQALESQLNSHMVHGHNWAISITKLSLRDCPKNATSAQARVASSGISATARSSLDPFTAVLLSTQAPSRCPCANPSVCDMFMYSGQGSPAKFRGPPVVCPAVAGSRFDK